MSFLNPGPAFRLAVGSLLLQGEHDWELIAIDDGSRAGDAHGALLNNDARIRLVRHEHTAGLATRLNEAVRLARGRYVARMDADDVAFPRRFEQQADFLDRHPATDVVATSILVIDERDEIVGTRLCPPDHASLTARPWLGIPMPHPTWMGKREWFLAHPYDESAPRAQDQHLLYRTYRRSHFAALTEPLLAYRHPRLSIRKTLSQRHHFLRAVWSNGPAGEVLKAGAVHAIAGARDILAYAAGLQRLIVDRRVTTASFEQQNNWAQLRAALRAHSPKEG